VIDDGNGNAILTKAHSSGVGLFQPPLNHLWIGADTTQDRFIERINERILVGGYHLDTILGFFNWSIYDTGPRAVANGNPDWSGYAFARNGKVGFHPAP